MNYFSRHNSASSILYSDNNVDSTKCTETGDLIPRRYALANSNSVSSATSPNDSKTQSIASVIPSTKRQNLSVSYEDIIKKFSQALENYGKFSFASRVQCDCIVRNVDVFIFRRAYIEAEAFIHERMAVLLDDKFAYFNNQMKAHICLICAAVCTKIGFRRKTAFYMRLSVLFQLNVASSNPVSDSNDYKTIYPLLYQSLKGYGLNDNRVDLVGGRWPDVDTPIITTTFSPIPHHTDAWNGCSATTKNVPFAIQIKAVSEVFISASRAGFYDVAIRHICFILQKYFEYMGMDEVLEKISELHKLVEMYGSVHSLAQPISLYEHNIVLPPVEFNRFPQLKDFNICPLMEYLSPTIVDAAASKIFIYSPFQDRKKRKEVLWVVDCPCEVFISVSNPLPVELVVKNLTLIVSGCRFESNPIRLNLPSCYGADISPNPPEIKVTGIPRSAGTLKITGYSCEILGVKTVCSLLDNNEIDKMKIKNRECVNYVSKSLSVRVLEKLPLLTLETSLKMTPTTTTLLAEATVFSGQMLHHLIYLHNTSDEMTVERVAIKIQQPVVYGGPNLIDVLDTLDVRNILPGERREIRIKIFGIDPAANPTCNQNGSSNSSNTNGGQTAITHNSIPSVNLLGEEHRVYVRRNTSLSIVQSEMSDTSSVLSLPHPNNNFKNADVASTKLFASKHEPNSITPNGFFNNSSASLSASSVEPSSIYQGTSEQQSSSYKSELSQLSVPSLSANLSQKEKNDSVDSIKATDCVGSSNIAITNDGEGHDLIPYIGRLLSAEFAFTYTITSVSTENERYERVVRLPLAVAIVPAVNVVDWHILSGDGPSTRYVVVDVTNSTDVNAELTYDNGRMMWVQPKEVCRVPLLCPCCTEISSATFIAAMQLESHMMQMREIERLRKTLEKHISRYLDIRWSIPALSLNGLVPVGSLLSSVAFLKQLVIPEISVCIQVNDSTYISEDDVVVGIGELVQFKVTILVSTKLDSLNGIVALRCYQDLQNSQLQKINRDENIILFGPSRIPFCIRGKDSSAKENISPDENAKKKSLTSSMSSFEVTFAFAFRFEGIHKIRPEIIDQTTLSNRHVPPHSKRFTDETIFIPYASFNVVSKA